MKKKILIVVSMVICLMTLMPRTIFAVQYDNAENARSVGGISFYEDGLQEIPPNDTKSQTEWKENARGFLPKTGENQQLGIILSGTVLVSIILIILYLHLKNNKIRGDK